MRHQIRPREKKCGTAASMLSTMREGARDRENSQRSASAREPALIDPVREPLLRRQRVSRLGAHRRPALHCGVRTLLAQEGPILRSGPGCQLGAVELYVKLHRELV